MFSSKLNRKASRLFSGRITGKPPTGKMSAQPIGLQLEQLENRLLLDAEILVGTLLGPIVDPDITSGVDQLDFGIVAYDDPALEQTFEITNVGDALLTVGTVSVTDGFSIQSSNQPDSSVAPAASTTFTVQFDTVVLGTHTGIVNFVTNDSDENPFTFTLTGFVNAVPTADAGGDRTVNEGQQITFSGSYDDPNARADDPVTFLWDFGGGNTATTQNATFTFDDEGSYPVSFTVNDAHSGSNTSTINVTVDNADPVVDNGGTYVITEGDDLILDATGTTDPGSLDVLSYTWDLNNDGTFGDATGDNPTVLWATLQGMGLASDASTLPIAVQVDDGDGGVVTSWTTLTINNDDPTAVISGPPNINEGTGLTLDGTGSTDLDSNDILTYAWDIDGDGTVETFTGINGNPTIPWPALEALGLPSDSATTIKVGLRVSDGDGGDSGALVTTDLIINNIAPTVSHGGDYTINEGEDLVLDASGTTDPGNDSLTYGWDLDGVAGFEATGVNPTVPWATLEALALASDGTVLVNQISLTVTDDVPADTVTVTTDLTINNVAPTADTNGPYTITEGNPVILDGTGSSDPDFNDLPLAYAWDLNSDGVYGGANEPVTANPTVLWSDLLALTGK